MNFKKNIVSFLLAALLIIFSYLFLDARFSLFVRTTFKLNAHLHIFFANIPDVLLPVVCAITVLAWTAYFTLSHKGIYSNHTRFVLLVANSIPLTFILELILKHVVGRINTRYWLLHPTAREFHWFQGYGNYAGFPSGHMAVFTALVIALWTYYPRYRFAYFIFLSVLALALLATNYHFLSDIIAGAYLGMVVHAGTLRGLMVSEKSKEWNEVV
jgi:membrane-associated phospholipid phosphatase